MTIVYFCLLGVLLFSVGLQSSVDIRSGGIVAKRVRSFLSLLIVIITVLIMAHSTYSDLKIYRNWYTVMSYNPRFALQRFEIGYGNLMFLCTRLGLNYYFFKLLVFSLCWGLLWYVTKQFSGNLSFFVAFFLMYELFFNGIQIRNFLAVSLVLVGVSILVGKKEPDKRSLLLYCLFVLAATSIHSSSIIYFAFAIIWFKPAQVLFRKRSVRWAYLLCIAVLTLVARHGLADFLVRMASESSDVANRIDSHSAGSSRFSPIYISIMMLLYLAVTCLLCYQIKQDKRMWLKEKLDFNDSCMSFSKKAELVEMINYIGLLFIPFVFLSTTYYRLIRTVTMFDLIFFSAVWVKTSSRWKRLLIFAVNIGLILMWVYYDLIEPGRLLTHTTGYFE